MLNVAALVRAFDADAAAVLARRWALLDGIRALLGRHGIPLSLDRSRFHGSRLYAAVALFHQERIVAAMRKVAAEEAPIEAVREACADFWFPEEAEQFALVHCGDLDRMLSSGLGQVRPTDRGFERYLRVSGMEDLVRTGVGLVLVDELRTPEQAVRNHSDDYHLFTVHTDVIAGVPAKTGEAIVHESGHNLLNLFLEARGIQLAVEPHAYYSPWTQSMRHHRGIVHGFFVFCLVTSYYLGLCNDAEPGRIEEYVAIQRRNLSSTLASLRAILSCYPRELGDLVENVYSAVE